MLKLDCRQRNLTLCQVSGTPCLLSARNLEFLLEQKSAMLTFSWFHLSPHRYVEGCSTFEVALGHRERESPALGHRERESPRIVFYPPAVRCSTGKNEGPLWETCAVIGSLSPEPLEGGRGCLMSPLLYGISGLSFDSTLLSTPLLFCLILLLFLFFVVVFFFFFFGGVCLLVHSPELFSRKFFNIFR